MEHIFYKIGKHIINWDAVTHCETFDQSERILLHLTSGAKIDVPAELGRGLLKVLSYTEIKPLPPSPR